MINLTLLQIVDKTGRKSSNDLNRISSTAARLDLPASSIQAVDCARASFCLNSAS